MKSILAKVAWAVTALASMNVGLESMGRGFFNMAFVKNNMCALIMPMKYGIGILGLVSFVMFCMMCRKDACKTCKS